MSTYTRKTRDEFRLYVKYGSQHGYEHELTEDSVKEIRQRQKEYRENCPQYPVYFKRHRVKLDLPCPA